MPRNQVTTRHKGLRMPVKLVGYRLEADGCVIYLERTADGTKVVVVPHDTSKMTARYTETIDPGRPMSVHVNVFKAPT